MRAILTYHSIDTSRSVLSIDPDTFRAHVEWLASGRVRVLPLGEIAVSSGSDAGVEGIDETGAANGDDAVALTFDDGLESFATHAWPLLRDHGLPSTVFVVADRAGGANVWEPPGGLPPHMLMDWSLLGRLHAQGVDVGSHSRTHASLPGLEGARLDDEVAGARERIRTELGTAPTAFAYPYGDYDERVVARVASCYRHACTTDLRPLRTGESVHALPRLDTYYLRRPGAIESWGSIELATRLRIHAAARSLRRRFNMQRARR